MNFLKKIFNKSNFDEKSLKQNDLVCRFDVKTLDFGNTLIKHNPKKLKFYIDEWKHNDGTHVFKGETLGYIKAEVWDKIKGEIKAPESGYFKKIIEKKSKVKDQNIVCLVENSSPIADDRPVFRVLERRKTENGEYIYFFTSTLINLYFKKETDGFTKKESITPVKFITLGSNLSEIELKMLFFKGSQYCITLEFYKKHFNIKEGDKLLLLLENDDVLEIIFLANSSRVGKESDGVIYANTQQIEIEKLNALEKSPLSQWRLELSSGEIITGKLSNSYNKSYMQNEIISTITCLKKLVNE